MFCKYCGKQIDSASKFCRYCGGKLAGDGPEVKETPGGYMPPEQPRQPDRMQPGSKTPGYRQQEPGIPAKPNSDLRSVKVSSARGNDGKVYPDRAGDDGITAAKYLTAV